MRMNNSSDSATVMPAAPNGTAFLMAPKYQSNAAIVKGIDLIAGCIDAHKPRRCARLETTLLR